MSRFFGPVLLSIVTIATKQVCKNSLVVNELKWHAQLSAAAVLVFVSNQLLFASSSHCQLSLLAFRSQSLEWGLTFYHSSSSVHVPCRCSQHMCWISMKISLPKIRSQNNKKIMVGGGGETRNAMSLLPKILRCLVWVWFVAELHTTQVKHHGS